MSKKNNKPKWNRAHEFKRKKSNKHRVGHPVYVYGRRGRNAKYLVFTHTPEKGKEQDYEQLKHNIDPNDSDCKTFIKKKYEINDVRNLREPDKKYRIHDDDKATIKKYKK